MAKTTATVPTANAVQYMKQLCNHWAHKLDVELSDNAGVVRFGEAEARMSAASETLTVTIEAEDEATLERMKPVMASHLDRFAFREAPLQFAWQPSRWAMK